MRAANGVGRSEKSHGGLARLHDRADLVQSSLVKPIMISSPLGFVLLAFALLLSSSGARAEHQCTSSQLACPGNSVNTPACFNRIRSCLLALVDDINRLENADVAFDARLDAFEASLNTTVGTVQFYFAHEMNGHNIYLNRIFDLGNLCLMKFTSWRPRSSQIPFLELADPLPQPPWHDSLRPSPP